MTLARQHPSGVDPIREAVALLVAAAAEHERAGRPVLALSHRTLARRLAEDLDRDG